jgi:hypothetical protein
MSWFFLPSMFVLASISKTRFLTGGENMLLQMHFTIVSEKRFPVLEKKAIRPYKI